MKTTKSAPSARKTPSAVPAPGTHAHTERALDEALRESFPSSDPVAINVTPPADVDKAIKKQQH